MIEQLIDRKVTIRGASPTAHVRQRIAQAADELNRAGAMAARVELVNEALCKFAILLYQKDTDGTFANIDSVTGRVLVCAPWGSAGWQWWGLRNWEARVLRSILMSRLTDAKRPPLFDYGNNTWYLDRSHYRSIGQAQHHLEQAPVTVSEWRTYAKRYAKPYAKRCANPVTNPMTNGVTNGVTDCDK